MSILVFKVGKGFSSKWLRLRRCYSQLPSPVHTSSGMVALEYPTELRLVERPFGNVWCASLALEIHIILEPELGFLGPSSLSGLEQAGLQVISHDAADKIAHGQNI